MSALARSSDNLSVMPRIPGYRISRVIGHGGMSTVYLGTQLSLMREVAIKIMRADVLTDEVSRRRFENEARTIARLEHPYIVNIHEVGRTGEGLPWYSMPYLGRGHLGQRDLTQDHARIRQILEILLSALSFAHARGVIHRDVKAENVLFDETDHPLLADFGVALRRGHGTRITSGGLVIGSTAYMAPEQARGQQVDPRSDLYSVGVLAWEMLTGQLPYQADDAVAMALAHVQTPLPRLPPGLRHWQRFMNQALAKQPQKRFHDAEHMLAELRAIPLSQAVHPPRWRWLIESGIDYARTHQTLVWTGAAMIGALVIALPLSLRYPANLVAVPESEPVSPAAEVARQEQEHSPVLDTGESDTSISTPPPVSRPLRTAPTSLANHRLEQVHLLLADKSPTLPRIRQAIDLWLAAYRADSEHLQLSAARDALSRRLGALIVAAIEDGDDVRAQALLKQWPRIRTALSPSVNDALHSAIFDAISTRLGNLQDAVIAQRSLETARLAGLSSGQMSVLRTRARALEPPPGWTSLRLGERLVHIDTMPVTRAAYARFIEATSRPAAACRERASMLRLLAPRDWTRPGFAQAGKDPVVCVSWQDAVAYAAWASQRDGRHYRLPSLDEAATLPAADDARAGRPLAEWRSDCDLSCRQRMVSGRSWRSRESLRLLAPERGYHDVGFRLALDPPAISPPAHASRNLVGASARPGDSQ